MGLNPTISPGVISSASNELLPYFNIPLFFIIFSPSNKGFTKQ